MFKLLMETNKYMVFSSCGRIVITSIAFLVIFREIILTTSTIIHLSISNVFCSEYLVINVNEIDIVSHIYYKSNFQLL